MKLHAKQPGLTVRLDNPELSVKLQKEFEINDQDGARLLKEVPHLLIEGDGSEKKPKKVKSA